MYTAIWQAPSFGNSKSRHLVASICKLVRNEDEDLGARLAGSIAYHSAEDAADLIAAALVKTTAEAMSRCLIGDAEATVKNFLQVLEGDDRMCVWGLLWKSCGIFVGPGLLLKFVVVSFLCRI